MTLPKQNWNASVFLSFTCLASLTIAGMCPAQDKESTRAERAAKLDAKVSELRTEFKTLREKLVDASDQARSNLRAELNQAGSELSTAYGELETAFDAEVLDWSQTIEQAWKEAAAEGEQLKAATAKDLERARQSWSASYRDLRKAYRQHVAHLQGELSLLEQQAEAAADDLSKEWLNTRIAARKRYQATAEQMRESYQKAIAELDKEIDRLEEKAETASDEVALKLTAMAESLSSDLNVLHEELQKSYQDAAKKTDRYLARTRKQLKSAGDEVEAEIQAEADQVSEFACQLHAEMAACCEDYRESLDDRIAAIQQQAQTAKGEAKQKLQELNAELDAKSKQAGQQIESAYQAYIDALNADIDFAKQQLEEADDDARAAMIKRIDKRQAQLEKAKRKLQEK